MSYFSARHCNVCGPEAGDPRDAGKYLFTVGFWIDMDLVDIPEQRLERDIRRAGWHQIRHNPDVFEQPFFRRSRCVLNSAYYVWNAELSGRLA